MNSVALALVPSPLLGPSTWAPVADRLSAAGWTVTVPRIPTDPQSPGQVLEALRTALPRDRPLVLVAHSNAGLYVPALGAGASVVGHVLVDAGLAPPDGRVALAPELFLEFLQQLADEDDVLPPWTAWWEEPNAVSALPDELRRCVEREARRLPLAYFQGSLPVPDGWAGKPAAYLAFGETYAEDRDRAAELGWPVVTMEGEHLHMLMEPAAVASAITSLLERIGAAPG